MPRRLATIWRPMMMVLLAWSVSLCCCQTHILLQAFASGQVDSGHRDSDGCCAACCQADVADDASDTPAPAPAGSKCKTCCVKGSGLKQITETVALSDAPPLLPDVTITDAAPFVVRRIVPREDAWSPHVAPPTLLRLRCAFII